MPIQTAQLESIFKEGYSFSDLLPHIECVDGVFVLADGSLGKMWELRPIGVEGRSDESLSALMGQWEGLLTRMPSDRLACQFILCSEANVEARLNAYSTYREESGSESIFSLGKEQHLRAGMQGLFTHRGERTVPKTLRLYVTVRFFPQWARTSVSSKIRSAFNAAQGPRQDIEREMAAHRAEFLRHTAMIEGAFQAAGAMHVALGDEDLTVWLYRCLNPERSITIPNVSFNPEEPIRDQVIYHAPRPTYGGFILENTYTRVVTLKELPPATAPGMFTREFYDGTRYCLLDMPQDFMLVINLTVPGAHEAMGRLNMQKNFAFMHKDNWLGDQSVEAVEKKRELDETIAHMYKGGGKIVHARIHWVLRDRDEAALAAACNDLLGKLGRLNCGGTGEELIGASLFLTCLPLNFDPYFERFIRRARRMASGNAADMLPVFGSFEGTRTPAQIYCNRRGEVVNLDFFDGNINPHGIIIGASGAGKSFFVNDFILQNDRLGAHFFVLDRGDSYKKLSAILDGRYISFDLNNPVTINPFANPPTPENLSFLLSLLSQMASGGDERDRLNREEEGLLHKAILRAYEMAGSREVTLSDVTDILKGNHFNEEYGINSLMGPTLALRLTPFTRTGPYGGFFDGPHQFQLKGRFTVFELANLNAYPDLQVTVLLNLMFFMTNFVSAAHMKPKRKYLFIDEAWSLLKIKNTADFITSAFKTFRKYRCSVVAVTQEITDLTRQESGMAIVANAANKIFLKQDTSAVDALTDKLALDEGTAKALKTIETVKGKFSEAYVMTDTCRGIIRLIPDPFLYWAANSEPRNNEYLNRRAEECGGSLIEAIKRCAKEHPYGV